MMKQLLCFVCYLFLFYQMQGQRTYLQISQDTIVQLPGLLGKTYFLDGKKLNLSVMNWFMTDYPAAHDKIRVAVLTDQVSIVGYTLGGLFGFTGLLIQPKDAQLSNDLLKIGAVTFGAGMVLQIVSGTFQRRAVRAYNQEVLSLYKIETVGYKLHLEDNGLIFSIRFD